ncbi:MAG: Mov34/MPN/PAD-1 family protein [Thermoplasmata archaeon]
MPRKPRILSSEIRPAIDREPPSPQNTRGHDWLSDEGKERYAKRLKDKGYFELYVSKQAAEKMVNHAKRFGRIRREALGFMLGDVCISGRRRFVMVRDIVTGPLLSSADRVRFDKENYSELFAELDSSGFDYVIVGWYHSHPGYGCFMSRTDLNTQQSAFKESFHSAIVIDPLSKEIAAFKLKGRNCVPLDFSIYWHDLESPYPQESVRRYRVVKKPKA